MSRLPTALSADSIRKTWAESRDSKPGSAGAPGIDGISAAVFSSNLADEIAEMRTQIRAGVYRFSRLRMAPVPKDTGGYRIIAIPTIRDRLLQRALLRHLENDPRFNATSPISFGFCKQKTLPDAQRRALELRESNPWVLQADIIKFFDRIPRTELKALIRKRVRAKMIAKLLCDAVDCELDEGGKQRSELARSNGIKVGVGLRQGMPVSPMLSNLLLQRFDEALIKNKIIAIRYADDLAIFGASKNECLNAHDFVVSALKKLQLKIPELTDRGKTTLKSPSESIEFLGVEIRRFGHEYKFCAPTGKLEGVDKDMKKIASVEECLQRKRNLAQVAKYLDNFIIGHLGAMSVLDRPEEFLNRLNSLKEKHLRCLLENLFGKKALENLDENRKAILGLGPFPKRTQSSKRNISIMRSPSQSPIC